MNNKVTLITGEATGIGKATALILASRGVKVVISGRRETLGQKLVEEIRASGGEAAFIAAGVDDEAEVLRTIEFAVSKYGRLDLAVNNAGIANETRAIGDSDPAMFQAMLQMNVMGLYPRLQLKGLDPNSNYRIDVLDGRVSSDMPQQASGAYWMDRGIDPDLQGDFCAMAFRAERMSGN